jgi:hypothetical protein
MSDGEDDEDLFADSDGGDTDDLIAESKASSSIAIKKGTNSHKPKTLTKKSVPVSAKKRKRGSIPGE